MGAESQKLCAECMRCLWTRTGIISQNVAGTPKMINNHLCLSLPCFAAYCQQWQIHKYKKGRLPIHLCIVSPQCLRVLINTNLSKNCKCRALNALRQCLLYAVKHILSLQSLYSFVIITLNL